MDEGLPEADKVDLHRAEMQVIGEFLEWLDTCGVELVRYDVVEDSYLDTCSSIPPKGHRNLQRVLRVRDKIQGIDPPGDPAGYEHPLSCICKGTGLVEHKNTAETYVSAFPSIQTALAAYFDIDYEAYEDEREQMLARIRSEPI